MLESIYWAITWACNRTCPHCYDERFRPYPAGEGERLTAAARETARRVVRHLPESLEFRDLEGEDDRGEFRTRTGRIILSGGEVLLEPTRRLLLYPLLERLRERYGRGVRLVVQTGGDLLTPAVLEELLERGVWMISVSSIDAFHGGEDRAAALEERLTAVFAEAGVRPSRLCSEHRRWEDEEGPRYSFFGATPGAWIGKLWPSGRAWKNGLSTAGWADNFCRNWSGGMNFLNGGWNGSEVAIDPDGNLYPCCRKTRVPYGNVAEEPLREILGSLVGLPPFEAISAGVPERMGLSFGIDPPAFAELSRTVDPAGRPYRNRCIGCDRIHEEHIAPLLARLRRSRKRRRRG
ncbi:MAG: radical SAM protein [Desulfobacterales bacterium]